MSGGFWYKGIMISASLRIWVVVVVLALSSCAASHVNRSPDKVLPVQQGHARSSSKPAAATEPKSAPNSIASVDPQSLIQNPVDDSSLPSSSANSSAIANSLTTQQDPRIALAQHLTSIGAKIYTTGWCQTCKRQQRDFGEAAFAVLTVINCDEKPNICADAGVSRFPTWEINGQKYERGFPLHKLAQLSNYSGPAVSSP